MMFRRKFLACAPAFTAFPAFAASGAPSVIAAYEKATGGRIGVYACNLATRQRLTWRENDRFALCSTFKVSLVALVLQRVEQGKGRLDEAVSYTKADIERAVYAPVAQASLEAGKMSVRALCQAAIEQSDNACANLLLARVGGPENLTRFWRSLGDQATRLDDWEPDLNRVPPGSVRNTTTPAAMAGVLEHLLFGEVLSASSRLLLTEWLKGCQTGRNRLRAGFPAGWEVGDKTGTNGQDAAGDCAVAWPSPRTPLIVCVYTRGGHPAEDQFRAAFAGIARLAGQTLAQSSTN
ncbi:class A beta-lactamase [Acetobacter persici]|uniref:class A beta-lactamase n=1 Tax=Acetobacter persici TaxID=1076596 RepID=UPI0015C518C0|nr:class A beta-lactamase [Acetobacter persici]